MPTGEIYARSKISPVGMPDKSANCDGARAAEIERSVTSFQTCGETNTPQVIVNYMKN
jgi:hypothetical protein